ncbi:hypothetical protein DFLDMN_006222 (plasmid) [Cupriavidus sp. H19C3]
MYGREQRVLLRHYLEQGLPKAEIARQLGVSLRTLYYWIDSGQLDRGRDQAPVRYGPRPVVPRKLDRFSGIITARLAEYPRLSATRLFEEIRAAGYEGGYTQVKEFVRKARPGAVPEPVVRFETPAGRQAQVDFAEFRLPWGKRYALLVVLSYSRRLWLQFYSRQSMGVLMRGLEQAFAFFGGVPVELLFDQMKAVVVEDQRPKGGRQARMRKPQCAAKRANSAFSSTFERPDQIDQRAVVHATTALRGGDGKADREMAVLSHPAVLVVDEIGYLPITHSGAVLFFQLMNRRYERASTVLTSNKGFEEWGSVFGDEVMAAALIDRVLHHCHLVNIRGNSYRMREHAEHLRALRDDLLDPPDSNRRSRRTRAIT